MKALQKIHECLSMVLKVIGFVLTLSVPVIMVVQVILRYVFKAPLMGTEELLQFPTIWMYMMGAVLASISRSHIECGVLSVYVKSPKVLAAMGVFKSAVTVVAGAWLTKWCGWYLLYSIDKWKLSALLRIPMTLGDAALFVGVLLMTVYAVVDLVLAIRALRAPPANGVESAS